MFRLGLRLGVRPKHTGLQGNGVAGGARVLVGVNKSRAESFRGKSIGRLVLSQAETIMPSPKHVKQRVADVLGEFPVHGAAVIIFMAGGGLPDAVFGGRGSPAPGIDLAQRRAIGILAIRKSVINSGGILHHFRRRAGHGCDRGAGRSHLPEAVGVDT